MYTLLLSITLLANQPYGKPSTYLETLTQSVTATEQECKNIIPYTVSSVMREYVENGKYVSIVAECNYTPTEKK